MNCFRPIKRGNLTQWFGENKNSLYATLKMRGHNGGDWGCVNGTPVHWYLNDTNGTVDAIFWDNLGGMSLYIISSEDGKFYRHRFFHLQKADVYVGQVVKPGMMVAHSDNTGKGTTGPHLHALDIGEVKKDKNGNWEVKNRDNGYGGSIDPTPWYTDKFILDELCEEANLEQQLSLYQRILEALKELIKGR